MDFFIFLNKIKSKINNKNQKFIDNLQPEFDLLPYQLPHPNIATRQFQDLSSASPSLKSQNFHRSTQTPISPYLNSPFLRPRSPALDLKKLSQPPKA